MSKKFFKYSYSKNTIEIEQDFFNTLYSIVYILFLSGWTADSYRWT